MIPLLATQRQDVLVAKLDQRWSSLRLSAPQDLARLRGSVERMGLCDPVLVSTAVEPGHLVLVDGFKRVRIVTELGATTVAATLLELEAKAAKAAILARNRAHHGMSELEEAWIVRSLCREQELPQLEVGRLLGHDKSWVSRRLMLAERLDPELQEQIRLGLLSATMAREISRLPRGNQPALARAIQTHGLSSRQVAKVVTALLGADDPDARREVLSDPLRYLWGQGVAAHAGGDPRLDAAGNALRRELLGFHQASLRLWQSTKRHASAGLLGEQARILGSLVEQAQRTGHATCELLGQLLLDSGALVEGKGDA